MSVARSRVLLASCSSGRDIGSIRAPDSTDPDAYADCCKACAAAVFRIKAESAAASLRGG